MRWKAAFCSLVLSCIAGPAVADTHSFLTLECSYTLPDKRWEWLDPRTGTKGDGDQTIALARNHSGMTFVLRVRALEPGYKPGKTPFAGFEAALLQESGLKKTGSKTLTFKGMAAYQVDAQAANGVYVSRGLYANDRFYFLMVGNQLGQTPTKELETIFQGFNFTGKPRPMVPLQPDKGEAGAKPDDEVAEQPEESGLDTLFRRGKGFVGSISGLSSVAFVALILFGCWTVIRIRG